MVGPVFDQRLYELKLAALSRELGKKIYAAERRVHTEQRKIGQPFNDSYYAKLVDARLVVLRWRIERVDRICREVWQIQGGKETPDFVRTVLRYKVLEAIASQTGSIRGKLELAPRRVRLTGLAAPLRHLARERRKLESELSQQYEAEAIELEHRAKQRAALSAKEDFTSNLRNRYAIEAVQLETQERRAAPVTEDPSGSESQAPKSPTPVEHGNLPVVVQAHGAEVKAKAWEEISISFLSEERIQIEITRVEGTQTFNYAEFGFEDRRNRKPNKAWTALLILARSRGPITQRNLEGRMKWPNFEKRMEEIRRAFKNRFGLPDDPVPYMKSVGYQARFKIYCARSFET